MRAVRIPEISVVVLCYKSGEFARIFHQKVVGILKKNKLNYEVVLVGNYKPRSNDLTPKVVTSIAKKNRRTIAVVKPKLKPDQNMGWDMKAGLKATSGKVIAVIDGDGQMIPNDIVRLYKKLKRGGFDLCKTKRVEREDGIYRKIVSFIFNLIMKASFPGIISDINGKPKLFSKRVYKNLKLESNDWFIDAEIMIKARNLNLKIGELKTSFKKNPERKSFITFRENFEFLNNILKWRFKELKIK